MSSAIDEAMARFSISGEQPGTNYHGCQPYQQSPRRGAPPPPIPDSRRSDAPPIDPHQIIAQILSANKNRSGGGGGGESSSNNSSSSRTGGVIGRRIEQCDMATMQSEYENVRPPMRLPAVISHEANNKEGKTRRRLGRQESRYTSGKKSD